MEGVFCQKLLEIPTPNGSVLHFLRAEYPLMPYREHFGEIYFSEVIAGEVKAWKRHIRQNQLFAVPSGLLRLVLYDVRPNSPSRHMVHELFLGRPDHYNLVRIPAGIWYGFSAPGPKDALLCNAADIPHDPAESERLPEKTELIPYAFPEHAPKKQMG
ncbi:MAG: dTDP-4-dehydrorhamnose 3,5-epimerase [Desulfovibrio sp.]|nr:dTDP-4-dehydrorhamnose 3,5-epimerase [Desulfovibrio sp.]